ncbi:MAG: flagellar FlbD family protein [Chitinivibrionia bacterium]|nr:flagellar FlbD family protein [Chitinivibrionia bacterium]
MINLETLRGKPFILNADLIEAVEATPDTHIRLYTGSYYIVKNSVDEVVQKALEYRKFCGGTLRVVNKKSEEEEKW